MPRLAVRLLHAGLRHEPVRHVPEPCPPGALRDTATGAGRTFRQPLPLHRLPADFRRRAADGTPADGGSGRNGPGAAAAPAPGWIRKRVSRAAVAGRPARRPRGPSRRPAGGGLHRRGSVDHQDAHAVRQRAGCDPGRRVAARRALPEPSCDRRRRHAHRCLRRAGPGAAAVAHLCPALRGVAGAQLGHAGRQRRQRLTDRRCDALADRTRRPCGRDERARPPRAAAGGFLHRLPQERAGARRGAGVDQGPAAPSRRVFAGLQDFQTL